MELNHSKAKVDRAGKYLSGKNDITEEYIESDFIVDVYRASHLEPLSETTLELQRWLQGSGKRYYAAQRLKRKPQIIRKLRRLSVRLTQLQDIGGCRIVVDTNRDVSDLVEYIQNEICKQSSFKIAKKTDYRDRGRDDTGYRAIHLIIDRNKIALELQIRSRIQHYWAESIERTSIIYGHYLKEKEGDPIIINYFKRLSDILFEIECGRDPTSNAKIDLDKLRVQSENVIIRSDKKRILNSYVNEDIVKTLTSKENKSELLNNWIIVFDWNTGSFVAWDVVGRNSSDAAREYARYEAQFPAEDNYEVVMIGSSDVASVRQTHSHYFGIEKYENILESLSQTIVGLSTRMDIDVEARQILAVLFRKKYFGRKTISVETLRNHYLKESMTFDSSLRTLVERGLVNMEDAQSPVSLNRKRKSDIESYL
ncbi:RelA/SpoT domain-containing protein [Blastochloris sulfoviridis]|uniref:RelA/SpoT domain-containing protein n=1 Tax=Blastochloris sulfoviridis TaxID=50712 RepID=A0A5M6I5A8_9HYPH|nr:RelA/SpoT domain-containing protein [Blastochloris sulfoviridis]KAA5603382.1 RelA/SpoT domain-containing protein [Blastochloris sulfoviridis]